MASPFALFRKNQKTMMFVMIGMAMFSFVVLGAIDTSSDGGMATFPAVMGMFFGGVIGWVLSTWTFHQKTSGIVLWTVVGCIFGVVVGSFAGGNVGGPSPVVKTTTGGLSQIEIDNLQRQRSAANQFIERAFLAVNEQELSNPFMRFQAMMSLQRGVMFGFGQAPEEDVLLGHLLRQEAEKAGMVVNDDSVEKFINDVTQNKLSRDAYSTILSGMGISESQLFDALRSEMLARRALLIFSPKAEPTPEQLYQYYRRLNLSQTCEVIPVSVSTFEDQVKVPGDEELKKFFAEHKDNFPNQTEPGAPGFLQPDRVKLAYVQISYDVAAESLPEITDKEIEAYYEDNKETFRNADPFPIDDDAPMTDGDMSDDPTTDDPMPDAPKPEGTPTTDDPMSETPKPESPNDDTEKPETSTPKDEASEDKPAKSDTPKPDAPETDSPTSEEAPAKSDAGTEETEATKTAEPKEESSSSLDTNRLQGFASFQDEPKNEKPESKPADDKPAQTADAKPEDSKPADKPENDAGDNNSTTQESNNKQPAEGKGGGKPESAKTDDTPIDDKPTDDKSAEGKSEKANDAKAEPMETEEPMEEEPVYRPLDDDLKEEIREKIKQEKTLAKLDRSASDVRSKMRELGLARSLQDNNPDRLDDAAVAAELKKYAEEKGYEYLETPYLSAEELRESTRFAIGASTEPAPNAFERQNAEATVDLVFSTSPEQLYTPIDAEDPDTFDRFAAWKIGHREQHIPEFDEDGIKKQVVAQWKEQKARELAIARAQDIAKIVRKSEKELEETIADMTETGTDDGPSLVVIGTGPFTWLSRPSIPQQNFNSPPPISLTSIPAILGGASEDFMEVAFNELGEGDVGVAPNVDKSMYFIVKVLTRADENVVREQAISPQSTLLSPELRQLAASEQQETNYKWSEALKKRYGVEWVREDTTDSDLR